MPARVNRQHPSQLADTQLTLRHQIGDTRWRPPRSRVPRRGSGRQRRCGTRQRPDHAIRSPPRRLLRQRQGHRPNPRAFPGADRPGHRRIATPTGTTATQQPRGGRAGTRIMIVVGRESPNDRLPTWRHSRPSTHHRHTARPQASRTAEPGESEAHGCLKTSARWFESQSTWLSSAASVGRLRVGLALGRGGTAGGLCNCGGPPAHRLAPHSGCWPLEDASCTIHTSRGAYTSSRST